MLLLNNLTKEKEMVKDHDVSWDNDDDHDAFEEKYHEWEKRSWKVWLSENLVFPFEVERMEDEDEAYFTDIAKTEPFRIGHKMQISDIKGEDDLCGIIVKAKEGNKSGYVPLCDLEVTSKDDVNYWPVREYVVWFANS
jgi:hypothetical protein